MRKKCKFLKISGWKYINKLWCWCWPHNMKVKVRSQKQREYILIRRRNARRGTTRCGPNITMRVYDGHTPCKPAPKTEIQNAQLHRSIYTVWAHGTRRCAQAVYLTQVSTARAVSGALIFLFVFNYKYSTLFDITCTMNISMNL